MEAGSQAGYTFNTKITADDGAGTLTLLDACPFRGSLKQRRARSKWGDEPKRRCGDD